MDNLQELRQQCAQNMIFMGRMLQPDAFELPTPDFHYNIASTLQNPREDKINLIVPRDHAKSTLAADTCLPIWHIFFEDLYRSIPFEDRSRKFVVIASKSQREAKRRLRTIKTILQNEQLHALVGGDYGPDTAQKWASDEIILKDGTTVISTGWSQQGRGLKEQHQRPTLFVCDDVEDERNTKTVEQMEKNLEWLLQAVEPATARDGKLVVIGTPIHQRCLVKTLQDFSDWTTEFYKALYEEDGEQKALWPEKYSVEDLKKKKENLKAVGRVHIFYQEWLCQVLKGEDSPIQPHHFNYYDGRLITKKDGPFVNHYLRVTHRDRTEAGQAARLDEPELIPVAVTMGVDPASSTKRSADFSTNVPVAWTREGDAYVLEYFRERVDPMVHAEAIYDFYERFRPRQTRCESDAYQRMLRSYLNSEHFDERIPGLGVNAQAGRREDTKLDRHLGLQYQFVQGHVHIKPHMQAFREEWVLMDDASHDDLRDGYWWADQCKTTPSHTAEDFDSNDRTRRSRQVKDPMLA